MSVLLEVVCKKHPRYRAIRWPKADCGVCKWLYYAKRKWSVQVGPGHATIGGPLKVLTAGDNRV